MSTDLLIENLSNPALLFFVLGILAVYVKSDLEIPPNSSKFISMYLLFAIGFKGGHELRHQDFTPEVLATIAFGLSTAVLIPILTFFILRKKMGVFNAGAIAAAYGSVSAVTFVTAVNYLEVHGLPMHGHMVAVMALMESPAIIMPLVMGAIISYLTAGITSDPSDRFILAVLGASASYIAVPAAMKIAVPRANPGIYLPMALAVTFPINITLGLPIFFALVGG
jgi:hypothetical protein